MLTQVKTMSFRSDNHLSLRFMAGHEAMRDHSLHFLLRLRHVRHPVRVRFLPGFVILGADILPSEAPSCPKEE